MATSTTARNASDILDQLKTLEVLQQAGILIGEPVEIAEAASLDDGDNTESKTSTEELLAVGFDLDALAGLAHFGADLNLIFQAVYADEIELDEINYFDFEGSEDQARTRCTELNATLRQKLGLPPVT